MPTAIDMNSPVAYWGNNSGLLIFGTYKPIEHPINLAPNLTLLQGTVLGEVTATPGTFKPYAGSTVGTPAGITPTLTTSTTGGFLPATTAYYLVFAYVNGVGETVKSTEATITTGAGTTNSITINTPTTLPAGAIGINVYMGTVSGTQYFVGTTPATSYVVQSPAVGTRAPVGASTALAASDGTQNAKCILRYGCTTDANGNITIGNAVATTTGIPVATVQATTVGVGFNIPEPCIDALFGGFECWAGDLIGLDQAAITAGFGRIENGAIGGTGAVFRMF